MKLSVIVPCFNEAQTIRGLLDAVRKAPIDLLEVIVVDDGSIIPKTGGKEAALRTGGLSEASGESALFKMPTLSTILKNSRS